MDVFGTVAAATALTGQAYTIYSQFKDASKECEAWKVILGDLNKVIATIQTSIKDVPSSSIDSRQLSDVLDNYKAIIEEFTAHLDKYVGAKGLRRSLLQAGRRFTWSDRKLLILHARLSTVLAQLQLASQTTFHVESREQRLRERIDSWLADGLENCWASPPVQVLDKVEEGCWTSLVASLPFQTWCTGAGRTLVCDGKPGSGKTTALSEVAKFMESKVNADNGCVLKIFFDEKKKDKQHPKSVLRALALQLLRRTQRVPREAEDMYTRLTRESTGAAQLEAKKILGLISVLTKDLGKVFCFFDALDESPQDSGELHRLFQYLRSNSISGWNLFFTTRKDSPRSSCFDVFTQKEFLEIQAMHDDIQSYVITKMGSSDKDIFKAISTEDKTLREEIVGRLARISDGIFLLAKLGILSILAEYSRAGIYRALDQLEAKLERLPSFERLAQVYDLNFQRLNPLGRKVLYRLAANHEPLTVMELEQSIGIDDMDTLDAANIISDYQPSKSDIKEACLGLVQVDETTQTLGLLHLTLRMHIRSKGGEFSTAHFQFARSCLRYMMFSGAQQRHDPHFTLSNQDQEASAELRSKFPFFKYAANQWQYHSWEALHPESGVSDQAPRDREAQLENLTRAFLSDDAVVAQVGLSLHGNQRLLNAAGQTGLHIASGLGLVRYAQWLVEEGKSVNARNGQARTPLHYAALCNKVDIIKYLLQNGAEPDAADGDNVRPLRLAADSGTTEALVYLLQIPAVDVDATDSIQPIPQNTQVADVPATHVVTPPLPSEETGLAKEPQGRQPSGAGDASPSRVNTPQVSIETKGQVRNASTELTSTAEQPSKAQTITTTCVDPGTMAIIRIFKLFILPKGQTVMHSLARSGNVAGTAAALLRRPLLAARDHQGMTPLHTASKYGHAGVVRLLLAVDADRRLVREPILNSIDSGRLPIHIAAENGRVEVVELMVQHDPGLVSARDAHGDTPLHCACTGGNSLVVEKLLELEGVDLAAQNNSGKTPLQVAEWARCHLTVAVLQSRLGSSREVYGLSAASGKAVLATDAAMPEAVAPEALTSEAPTTNVVPEEASTSKEAAPKEASEEVTKATVPVAAAASHLEISLSAAPS